MQQLLPLHLISFAKCFKLAYWLLLATYLAKSSQQMIEPDLIQIIMHIVIQITGPNPIKMIEPDLIHMIQSSLM